MKKLVQICTVLSLLFVFSAIAANAQTVNKRYEASIPFDFNIGQKSFQAGNYVIKVSKNSESTLRMTLEDENRNILQTILVGESGDVTKGEPQLVFNRYENQRFLTKIMTSERGVVVSRSNTEKEVARNQRNGAKPPVVAVTINE